jgi:pyrroloquinoline quinone (PQQ) biosynthesis protein C
VTVSTPPRDFAEALSRAVEDGIAGMEAAHAVIRGALTPAALRRFAARYYGELRTFLDVKLPERLRLCGYGAADAKELFAHAYVEEQGHFRPGEDHASLFAEVCSALGNTPTVLEGEAVRHARRFAYMRLLEPAPCTLVRELAITYAWESVAPALGLAVAQALERHYAVPGAALRFYAVHDAVDREHSAAARRVLLAHATTADLRLDAIAAVREALDLSVYLETV